MNTDLMYEDETYAIRGAIYEVYKATGFKLGLLVNFCAYPKVDVRRRVL